MSEKTEALFAKVFEAMSSKHTYSEAEVRLVMLGMQAEIDRLKDECEALRADAGRYQWLKARASKNDAYDIFKDGCGWRTGFVSDDNRLEFGAAIDAAMAKGQTK